MTEGRKNDSRFQWVRKAGQVVAHAMAVAHPGKTACGLKVGRRWLKGGKGIAAVVYRGKCPTCRAAERAETRRAV